MRRSLSVVLVSAALVAVAGCGSDSGSGRPLVVFEVEGAAGVSTLEYHGKNGLETVTDPALPWRAEGRHVRRTVVMVKATSKSMEPVTCRISVDGKVVETATDSVAVCSIEVPQS